ncbi:MAG TPA: CBS domain-containing protein [Nitrososphaeraceae archaeon]|jgi:CBS domain-containing protein
MGIESIPVSSVMTRNVITETEDQNIQAVCKIMNENNIGSVIIVKEEIVAGNKLSDAKKTTIDGNRITNKAHIEWLKEMSRSEVCHVFRV